VLHALFKRSVEFCLLVLLFFLGPAAARAPYECTSRRTPGGAGTCISVPAADPRTGHRTDGSALERPALFVIATAVSRLP
jgi:hypothetical protein